MLKKKKKTNNRKAFHKVLSSYNRMLLAGNSNGPNLKSSGLKSARIEVSQIGCHYIHRFFKNTYMPTAEELSEVGGLILFFFFFGAGNGAFS